MDFFIYSQDSPKWYIDILIHVDSKKGQDKLQAFFSIFNSFWDVQTLPKNSMWK